MLRNWQAALDDLGRHGWRDQPELAVILGSGLGDAVADASVQLRIPYADITGLPRPSVSGHAGELIICRYEGWNVWCFSGRFHLYEGLAASEVVAPVNLAAAAGARRLLLTNAAGAINPDLAIHSFMCIDDQINLTGDNPLKGVRENPFVDLSSLYRRDLYDLLIEQAPGLDVPVGRGVIAAVPGPSYETPAEIRALRVLGADAVSMSTVPEAIMARYHDMEVAGLSFLSNPAAGCSPQHLDHQDVLAAGRTGGERLRRLLPAMIRCWQRL